MINEIDRDPPVFRRRSLFIPFYIDLVRDQLVRPYNGRTTGAGAIRRDVRVGPTETTWLGSGPHLEAPSGDRMANNAGVV